MQVAKELIVTSVLDTIQDYKRNWILNANRMPVTDFRGNKNYTPKGARNQERTLKRLLDVSVRNGSTRGPTA